MDKLSAKENEYS